MKKILSVFVLFFISYQFVCAQSASVTGVVNDEKGNPLHFVFIGDVQNVKATFTDSLGNFTLSVHPDSKLLFQLSGYKDTTVDIAKSGTSLAITLKSTGGPASGGTMAAQSNEVKDTAYRELVSTSSGGVIAPTHLKGNLKGSQYLFKIFAHGYIINASGEMVHKPNYLFDYDKVTGALLLTEDKKTIVQVNWDQVQKAVLFSNTDERIELEKAPAIDQTHYVQALSSGKKYKIYKLIKTRFVKADYVNNGVASHGNDYDEYIDDADYYVIADGGQPQKISLRKKSLKEAFAKDADKINKYLSDNSGSIDDAYLSKLGDYMNN